MGLVVSRQLLLVQQGSDQICEDFVNPGPDNRNQRSGKNKNNLKTKKNQTNNLAGKQSPSASSGSEKPNSKKPDCKKPDSKKLSSRKPGNRELSDKGKRGAQKLGVWLAQKTLEPDIVLCTRSPVARVTAEKLVKAMGADTRLIKEVDLSANGELVWKKIARAIPRKAKRVMVVGGKTEVKGVLSRLLGDSGAKKAALKSASLAIVSGLSGWSARSSDEINLKKVIHSKKLPDGFPYPHPDGAERRLRPAYYYRQSSVIPYRIENGRVQILLVASSSMKHWVVPKGIHEPGLSSAESAAMEALEEAGIEGEVHKKALGHYEYNKWGGRCRVVVYAIKVESIIPEKKWQESHRGRRWCLPEDATRMVRQRELIGMIRKLVAKVTSR